MTRPTTSSKLMLIADQRAGAGRAGTEQVRRYRIARLRLDGRSPQPSARFEHLKRVFD